MRVIQLNNSSLLLPDNSSLLSDNSDVNNVLENYFNTIFWADNKQVIGQSKGRNVTWFIQSELANKAWVLRHYYRGGLVAKIIKDRYLFSSIDNTRVYKEVALLEKMIMLGLPVPKPIAGRIQRKGIFYRADLLMEKLEANDLAVLLKTTNLGESLWQSIGKSIAQFHNKGIYHSDLNAHNIMIDDYNKVWLIDFDRCEVRKKTVSWQKSNIDRLKRSFEKELEINEGFNFCHRNWCSLLEGYNS